MEVSIASHLTTDYVLWQDQQVEELGPLVWEEGTLRIHSSDLDTLYGVEWAPMDWTDSLLELGFKWIQEVMIDGGDTIMLVPPTKTIALRAARVVTGGDDDNRRDEYHNDVLEAPKHEWGVGDDVDRRYLIAVPSDNRGHW